MFTSQWQPSECASPQGLCSTVMSSITANYKQYGCNNTKINGASEYLLCAQPSQVAFQESYHWIVDLRKPQIFGKSFMNIDQGDFIEIFIVKNHFEEMSNFVENSKNKERSLAVKGIQCIAGTLGCQRKIYFPLLSEHTATTIFPNLPYN